MLKSQTHSNDDLGSSVTLGSFGYYFRDVPGPSHHWSYLAALDDLGSSLTRATLWGESTKVDAVENGKAIIEGLVETPSFGRTFRTMRDADVVPISRSLLPILAFHDGFGGLGSGAPQADPKSYSRDHLKVLNEKVVRYSAEFPWLVGPALDPLSPEMPHSANRIGGIEAFVKTLSFLDSVLDPKVYNWIKENGTPLFDNYSSGLKENELVPHRSFPVEALVVASAISPLFDVLSSERNDDESETDQFCDATLRLRRAYILNVASAQSCIEKLKKIGVTVSLLPPSKIGNCQCAPALDFGNFWGATPLWYYALCERTYNGTHYTMGPLASHILGQTLFGILKLEISKGVDGNPPIFAGAWS